MTASIYRDMDEVVIILTSWKWATLGVIHSALAFAVMQMGAALKRPALVVPTRMLAKMPYRMILALYVGLSALLASIACYHIFGLMTLLILTAGFLTVWYLELAILLAYGFFKPLFDDEMPFEITLFISFVVMVNAGYFTLMFLLSVIRAPVLL